MKFHASLFVAFILLIAAAPTAAAQVQGQWSATGPLHSAREYDAQTVLSNGNALAVGGIDGSGNVLASAEIYAAATNTWTTTGSMAAAREVFPAVRLANGQILAVGGVGAGGTILDTAERYDPATGLWSPAGTLSVARYAHSATLLGNGKVLVTGGCAASACGTLTAVSELYNPATNTWSTTGTLKTARAFHNAVTLPDGKVMAIGGWAGGVIGATELYDPSTRHWTPMASTASPRYLSTATVLPSGKVLVTGGVITKYPLSSAELYDPSVNVWTPAGSMTIGRYAHSATLLDDGTVLLAGGQGQAISCGKLCVGFIPTAKTEIYNPQTGSFAAAANLDRARAYHMASLVRPGRALVDGGSGYTAYCCMVLGDGDSYVPLSLTFSQTALNFGYLQVGLTSAAQSVTVTDVSSHPVTFASIAASGDFAQTNTCPTTLNPGDSCTISVSFTPTVAGSRNGLVTFTDDSPGSPRQMITLSGTGEAQALAFAPSRLMMGTVLVGSTASQSAILINSGASTVTITGISQTLAHIYLETNACPASLTPQQSCTFQITFQPPDIFAYKATLTVSTSTGGAAALTLSGKGTDGGVARLARR